MSSFIRDNNNTDDDDDKTYSSEGLLRWLQYNLDWNSVGTFQLACLSKMSTLRLPDHVEHKTDHEWWIWYDMQFKIML